jgi:hypothetical protein
VTAFEVEVFFQFLAEDTRIIEERRRPELKLGLVLQIGFLRMSGRLLVAVRTAGAALGRTIQRRRSELGLAARDVPGALIHEPARSVEATCFLRYCLLLATDRLLMLIAPPVTAIRAASSIPAAARSKLYG